MKVVFNMEDKWPRGPLYQIEDGALRKPPCWVWFLCVYTGLVTGAFVCVCVLGTLHLQYVTDQCESGIHREPDNTMSTADTQDIFPTTTTMEADVDEVPRAMKHWLTAEEETEEKSTHNKRARTDAGPVVPDRDTAADGDLDVDTGDQLSQVSRWYTVMDNALGVRARVAVKPAENIVVYHAQATRETSSGIAVVDFTQHTVGLYISDGKDQCYLISGFDKFFVDAFTLLSKLESNAPIEPEGTEHFDLVSSPMDNVLDWTDLPEELWEICWGKDVFLLQHAIELSSEQGLEATMAVATGSRTLFLVIRTR